MKPSPCCPRMFVCVAALAALVLAAGCANIFVPKHKVLVDAIAAPGIGKPAGKSYRLLAKKSVVANVPVQIPVVKACLDAALTGIGMYEPPANVAPDVFIEVAYGSDAGPRADPAARETFLQLSARENPGRSLDRATGAEVWDVRVGVMGLAGRIESAMPLLCAVAANYVATDTHMEAKVEIPRNDPNIASVRETAIKALEAKAAETARAESASPKTPDASAPAPNRAPSDGATSPPPSTRPGSTPPPAASPTPNPADRGTG